MEVEGKDLIKGFNALPVEKQAKLSHDFKVRENFLKMNDFFFLKQTKQKLDVAEIQRYFEKITGNVALPLSQYAQKLNINSFQRAKG